MIDIASVDLSLDAPLLGEHVLGIRASAIFDAWEQHIVATLSLGDYSVRLELTEGSLKGKGKIAATAAAVYLGIGNFGGFVDGVREIARQSRVVGDYLIRHVKTAVPENGQRPVWGRRTAGRLAQLERLFFEVQKGELEPTKATEQAARLFSKEPDLPPEFLSDLATAISNLPRDPRQLDLPLEYIDTLKESEYSDDERLPKRKRESIPPIPPPARFRVEIWRESRSDPRHIVIEPL